MGGKVDEVPSNWYCLKKWRGKGTTSSQEAGGHVGQAWTRCSQRRKTAGQVCVTSGSGSWAWSFSTYGQSLDGSEAL